MDVNFIFIHSLVVYSVVVNNKKDVFLISRTGFTLVGNWSKHGSSELNVESPFLNCTCNCNECRLISEKK